MVAFATPIFNGFKADPYVFGTLLVALSTPGILLFFTGLFARAQGQAAAANALVLEAANHLLLPSAAASEAGRTHAQSLRHEAEAVERAMTQAVTVLQSFTGELETRRNSLFEATGASVEKTEGLIRQLGVERSALENLTHTIHTQLTEIGSTVPKQANILAQALKTAGNEVHNAEETLENRMLAFDAAEDRLISRMRDIDALAQSTAAYTERLEALVGQIESRLVDTTKLIDASVKAGEIASTAAHSTGQALQDAVSDALDGARIANEDIAARTIETAREAALAIKALKQAGGQTQEMFQTVAEQARLESARIDDQTNDALMRLKNTNGAGAWVKPQIPRTPDANPVLRNPPEYQAPSSSNRIDPDSTEDTIFEAIEDEWLEDEPDTARNETSNGTQEETSVHDTTFAHDASFIFTDLDTPSDTPIRLSRLSEATTSATPDQTPPNLPTPSTPNRGDNSSWGNILADVDRAASRELPPREETAEFLVIAFEKAGLDLHQIFNPKDKKRIAVAARRGDYARRSAIKEGARRYMDATESLLSNDAELKHAAHVFLEYENSEALNALEKTHKSNKNAGIRLALYLLLDAAVGKARAA